MQIRTMYFAFLLAGFFALGNLALWAQTDVAASVYGTFNGTVSASGVHLSASDSAGGIVELRHIGNPFVGYEATYSLHRTHDSYKPGSIVCPVAGTLPCVAPPAAEVKSDVNEFTGDWIVSMKVANLRPFALGGLGVLGEVPIHGQAGGSKDFKIVYVYGAGLDWGLLPHIGLRVQYRGNLYKAPDLTGLYTSIGKFTQTSEPMVGAYFRF